MVIQKGLMKDLTKGDERSIRRGLAELFAFLGLKKVASLLAGIVSTAVKTRH